MNQPKTSEPATNWAGGSEEEIGLGKRIEISVNGEFQCWDIVHPKESDIPNNKISIDAPLIQLILGLKPDEEKRGKIGTREVLIKIRRVS